MARDLYGKTVKVLVDDDTVRRRKVLKGYEDINRNVHFVTPVVRIDGVTYEITPNPNKRGYHEPVKKFAGERVDSRF